MNDMEISITPGRPEDAQFIGRVVADAIGRDVLCELGGSEESVELFYQLFTELAGMEKSQYSYRNSLVARTADGRCAGAIVAYDGARLHELREAFVEGANRILGWNIRESEMDDETDGEEVYLDSLMVLPEFRGQGIASALIRAAVEHNAAVGKPVGLLVDYTNPNARRLYSRLGFEGRGDVRFCGVTMEHMRLKQ